MPEIHLTLTHEELNIVIGALGEEPYKVVSGVISTIQQQLKAQSEGQGSQ